MRRGSLAVDEQGFVRIDEQLRSVSHLQVFATGDGRAIASRGPFGAEGAWAWRWKDRIDRRFLQQFVATQAAPPHASQPAQTLNPLAEGSARHSGESQ
jgi:hypothetical protein